MLYEYHTVNASQGIDLRLIQIGPNLRTGSQTNTDFLGGSDFLPSIVQRYKHRVRPAEFKIVR